MCIFSIRSRRARLHRTVASSSTHTVAHPSRAPDATATATNGCAVGRGFFATMADDDARRATTTTMDG